MKNFLRSMRMILARKLTPLKSVGLAFRKDKGDFKSGSKENNSCARDGAGVGCWISVINFFAWLADCLFDVSAAKNPQQAKGYLFLLWLFAISNLFLSFYYIGKH